MDVPLPAGWPAKPRTAQRAVLSTFTAADTRPCLCRSKQPRRPQACPVHAWGQREQAAPATRAARGGT